MAKASTKAVSKATAKKQKTVSKVCASPKKKQEAAGNKGVTIEACKT